MRSGQAGRVRQAQFCWWGAWAPWVLWADEGPESNEPLVPEGAGSQAGGQVLDMFGRVGSGPALDWGLQLPGTWWETSSLRSSLASGRPGQRAAGPLGAPLLEGPLRPGLPGRRPRHSSLHCPRWPTAGSTKAFRRLSGVGLNP